VEEYALRLDNLISNLEKVYKISGLAEFRTNKNILIQLDILIELHDVLNKIFLTVSRRD